jgi:hypothetical protein
MSTVFAKLNLKAQRTIVVLNAPASFDAELETLDGVTVISDAKRAKAVEFAIAFATTQDQLDAASKVLMKQAIGDAIVWVAYPKGTSKRYRCEFNRDSGWTVLRAAGFDTVRMVAIDDDWSALRFRRVEFIKPTKASGNASAKPVMAAARAKK